MSEQVTEPPLIDFDTVEPIPSTDFFEEPNGEPDTGAFDESYDSPESGFVTDRKRGVKAKQYEKKVAGVFNAAFRAAITNPMTVPDAAAISMHVVPISTALGDLAVVDARMERAIDWVTSGTENPYATAMFAIMPLALQVLRNHEPVLEPKQRGFKILFGKRKGERITLKFGIKLRGVRNMTNDPDVLTSYVFDNPAFAAALAKQGLTVVRSKPTR